MYKGAFQLFACAVVLSAAAYACGVESTDVEARGPATTQIPTTTHPDPLGSDGSAPADDEGESPSNGITTSSLGEPSNARAVQIPDVSIYDLATNLNTVTKDPVTELCWLQREVWRRQMLIGIGSPTERGDAAETAHEWMIDSVPTLVEDLRAIVSEIPPKVRPFANTLAAELLSAREVALAGLDRAAIVSRPGQAAIFSVDYARIPAYDEYLEAAEAAGCEDP